MTSENNFIKDDITTGDLDELLSLRYLAEFAAPWRWQLLVCLGLLLASAVATALSAHYLGRLIDIGILPGNAVATRNYIALILLFELLSVLLVFYGRRKLATHSSKIILGVRERMFDHIQQLPLRYFDTQPQGRTVVRMTTDVDGIDFFFTHSLGRIAVALALFVVCCIAMMLSNFWLGCLVCMVMTPAILLPHLTRKFMRKYARENSAENSAINSRLSEYIDGLPVLRSFGLERWSMRKFDERVEAFLSTCNKLNRFNMKLRPTAEALVALPLLALLVVGGEMVFSGTLSLGLLVAFVRYTNQFTRPVLMFSREIPALQQAFTSIDRVRHFLQARSEEEVLGSDGSLCARSVEGHIRFDDVSMSYDGTTRVLKNLSFELPAGTMVGLLGRTGSGKTSTVSLLMRLYEFQRGDILLDGVSIREYTRGSLRDTIGFVSQEVTLFRGSVYQNLDSAGTFGENEVIEASRATGLLQVLQRNGMSLYSELEDKGTNISVGERQLIAFTRVLLARPRLLILDEATANIDPELEEVLHKAVVELMKDRTCLIIAHRLSTLRSCDRLLVFRDGRIAETGTHDELMTENSYYRTLQESSQE